DADQRRGLERPPGRIGRRPLRAGAHRRARSLRAQECRSLLRAAGDVRPARARCRAGRSRSRRHGQAQDPAGQSAPSTPEDQGQGHAATPRARAGRRLLSAGARGAPEAQRQAARGVGGLRGGVEGARHAVDLGLPGTDEEAARLMSDGYWELAVPAPDDVAEALTNFLWELGALGVIEEQVAGGQPTLRAFFPARSEASTLATRVRDYTDGLRALGFTAPDALRVTALADADWGEAWREHFRPLPIGTRFLVVPPWESAACEPGRLTLVIEPARAFGTGHHGSTAGCLVQLEKIVGPGAPSSAHLRLAPSYARQVAGDGRLVLGGLLDAEATAVEAELGRHGFDGADVTSIEGWTTLALRRTR